MNWNKIVGPAKGVAYSGIIIGSSIIGYLADRYEQSYSRVPNLALGRIVQDNDHGTIVYITQAQASWTNIGFLVATVGWVLLGLVVVTDLWIREKI